MGEGLQKDGHTTECSSCCWGRIRIGRSDCALLRRWPSPDTNEEIGATLAEEWGEQVIFVKTNVTNETSELHAVDAVADRFGVVHVVVNCTGIGIAKKVLGKNGPLDLDSFARVIPVNLIGTFNVIRLAAAKMIQNEPNTDSERGVIIKTASVTAFEERIGQAAYSASKGGIVGMTCRLLVNWLLKAFALCRSCPVCSTRRCLLLCRKKHGRRSVQLLRSLPDSADHKSSLSWRKASSKISC